MTGGAGFTSAGLRLLFCKPFVLFCKLDVARGLQFTGSQTFVSCLLTGPSVVTARQESGHHFRQEALS